ncbi:MAG: competence/damage-inducible protein A [Clostridiales Family XIII bacterium]|nr:competence/damage-inducible protein A [Clostridiales Family XIII bacterium]
MNATILCVGTELLFGQIVNTNAAWLSQKLQILGINVLYHYTVGDNPGRMRETLIRALRETDLVITSGGLGPTQDDLTKEIIAEVMDDELVLDERALAEIETVFSRAGRRMTDNNRKQAYLPKSGTTIYNDVGTAPAFALEKDGKIVIALPGPPRELQHLFETQVLPMLAARSGSVIRYRMLRFYGVGESDLETRLEPLIDGQTDPTIATYAKEGECTVRIASKRPTPEEAETALDETENRIKEIVGKYLYSDQDQDLAEVVLNELIAKGLTISSAESCTGGLFADSLISYAGASTVFNRGFITYTNASKEEMLGVPAETLDRFGAVSEETAVAMAQGTLKCAGTDIAVSVTGIAGPDGGSAEKPVGLAWIAVVTASGELRTKKHYFRDRGRNWNRKTFVLEMLHQVYCMLETISC